MVKWHNVHVWGTENPYITLKHGRDSPYAISKKVYSPFFFMENAIIGNTPYGLSQWEEDSNDLSPSKRGCYLTSTWLCSSQ
jgi:hypothetical protein